MNTPSPLLRMLSVRYYGRDFTLEDLAEIRAISAAQPHRAAIARAVCQHFNWLKSDGGLKTMSYGVALRRMQADGLIDFPPPVRPAPPPPKAPPVTAASNPQPLLEGIRGDLGPLESRQVALPAQSRLSGYCRLAGAQLRCLVSIRGQPHARRPRLWRCGLAPL